MTQKNMETVLGQEYKSEAEDILNFTKLLTDKQKEEFETLLKGVKIGYDLARNTA